MNFVNIFFNGYWIPNFWDYLSLMNMMKLLCNLLMHPKVFWCIQKYFVHIEFEKKIQNQPKKSTFSDEVSFWSIFFSRRRLNLFFLISIHSDCKNVHAPTYFQIASTHRQRSPKKIAVQHFEKCVRARWQSLTKYRHGTATIKWIHWVKWDAGVSVCCIYNTNTFRNMSNMNVNTEHWTNEHSVAAQFCLAGFVETYIVNLFLWSTIWTTTVNCNWVQQCKMCKTELIYRIVDLNANIAERSHQFWAAFFSHHERKWESKYSEMIKTMSFNWNLFFPPDWKFLFNLGK